MSAPWPNGPDGRPLPTNAGGWPAWPSEEYRQAYEAGLQQQAAEPERRRIPPWRIAVAVLVVVWIVLVATLPFR